MKKILFAVFILLSLSACFFIGWNSYCRITVDRCEIRSAWSHLENSCRRRADLLPNLVATARIAGEDLPEADSLSSFFVLSYDVDELSVEEVEDFLSSQRRLSTGIDDLVEALRSEGCTKTCPDLSDILTLVDSTSSRIAAEEEKYNEAVSRYHDDIRYIPSRMIAAAFRLKQSSKFAFPISGFGLSTKRGELPGKSSSN